VKRRGPRKLKPSTRIRYLARDLKILRATLDLAGAKLSRASRVVDRAIEHGVHVDADQTGNQLREWASECAQWAHRLTGW